MVAQRHAIMSLLPALSLGIMLAGGGGAFATEPSPAASAPPAADRAGSEDLSSQCSARLENFVKELDQLLTNEPPSVDPFLALLERAFPVTGCNVDEALKVARTSKFLLVIDEWPKAYVIRFGNARTSRHRGFSISFGLLKDTGDSELPSASVNK